MVFVAVLLLPLVSVLLVVMDRIEERVFEPGQERGRHAGQRRHLRLIPGGRRDAAPRATEENSPEERRRAA
ncbi:hypothetical protein [Streptomyces sp. SID10815]|uniref:hypothetical protein n=1 Tax=Streptomyces sp. SID10815 TaxID=2706027 RepID=UPI0013CAB63D|nr:hypothetical protein [Streptomyces sp. SID10815]NEA49519.1 hypothetical protein [Streptomyces sp. SID10815]